MTYEISASGRGGAIPDDDEVAAIVAVFEALRQPDDAPAKIVRSRWRSAARSFENEIR